MYILITYDVNTASEYGARRLRQVAKVCLDYGQRVQNSVFECLLSEAQFVLLRQKLVDLIDKENDSIRFYFLGKNWNNKIEQIGKVTSFNFEGDLII